MKYGFLATILLGLASCGPQGRLAVPEQNIAERFTVEEGFRPSWHWMVPGGPALLSLSVENGNEMVWAVKEKSASGIRRSRLASLQRPPRFFSQGPEGVSQVRFSPSGKTILIHETSRDRTRFQTLLFQLDGYTGAWRSRPLSLGKEEETKARRLDDGSRVPGLLRSAVPPRILRLDEELVIYEVDGKTHSLAL